MQRYEYDVVELKETLFATHGSTPSERLRTLLNARAADGWQLTELVSGEATGALGARDTTLAIFERPLGAAATTASTHAAAAYDQTAAAQSIPPGWYADPAMPTRRRWWDGGAWTDRIS